MLHRVAQPRIDHRTGRLELGRLAHGQTPPISFGRALPIGHWLRIPRVANTDYPQVRHERYPPAAPPAQAPAFRADRYQAPPTAHPAAADRAYKGSCAYQPALPTAHRARIETMAGRW